MDYNDRLNFSLDGEGLHASPISTPSPVVCHSPKDNGDGSIDVILVHPKFGDIPYTARAGEVDAAFGDIYAKARAGEYGEIAPYVPPEDVPPTPQQIIARLTLAIQKRLDDFAKTRNYDNILSACTYATSSVPKFAAEGQYCVDARDATWAAAYALMDEVLAGQRPIPESIADLEPGLPVLAWPEDALEESMP
jgi:hypothetical protein